MAEGITEAEAEGITENMADEIIENMAEGITENKAEGAHREQGRGGSYGTWQKGSCRHAICHKLYTDKISEYLVDQKMRKL